ncbi:MAG TPA: hypothetical protein VE153_38655 [Myxococcus sp.]|nr:hypothetical protein [Myxococcus sp.]
MESLELEDVLSMASGDLAGSAKHQGVIRALLSGPAGTWRTLAELDPARSIERECQQASPVLAQKVVTGLRVAWTQHPDPGPPEEEDFCAILFFYGRDERMWHSVALFNRATL